MVVKNGRTFHSFDHSFSMWKDRKPFSGIGIDFHTQIEEIESGFVRELLILLRFRQLRIVNIYDFRTRSFFESNRMKSFQPELFFENCWKPKPGRTTTLYVLRSLPVSLLRKEISNIENVCPKTGFALFVNSANFNN